jgi:hypothetical protein
MHITYTLIIVGAIVVLRIGWRIFRPRQQREH